MRCQLQMVLPGRIRWVRALGIGMVTGVLGACAPVYRAATDAPVGGAQSEVSMPARSSAQKRPAASATEAPWAAAAAITFTRALPTMAPSAPH